MYEKHSSFNEPEENANIWRYMDFTKFLDLLAREAIFFPRADKLGDPFEGSFPRGNVMLRPITYKGLPESDLNLLSQFFKQYRRYTAISCWHINDCESAAMWRLYLKTDEGIAIKSTFKRLKDSFEKGTPKIYIGKVSYLDYDKEIMSREDSLSPFVHKRKSFEHEKELRAIIRRKSPFKDGLHVTVNLDTLIEKIYLAPTCPDWHKELIESINKRFKLKKEVIRSPLYDVGKVLY